MTVVTANVNALNAHQEVLQMEFEGRKVDVIALQEVRVDQDSKRREEKGAKVRQKELLLGKLRRRVRTQGGIRTEYGGVAIAVSADLPCQRPPTDQRTKWLWETGRWIHGMVAYGTGGRASMSSRCTER